MGGERHLRQDGGDKYNNKRGETTSETTGHCEIQRRPNADGGRELRPLPLPSLSLPLIGCAPSPSPPQYASGGHSAFQLPFIVPVLSPVC